MAWLADHLETVLLIVLLAVGSSLIILVLFANWGPYRGGDAEAARALLSSMATGLAAILALLVTLSLLATQLSATAYTARITQQRLKDPWLWGVVALYLAAILWSLVVLGASGLTDYRWSLDFVSVAFILTGIALVYLVPFTMATLKSLQPQKVARWLIKNEDYAAIDELLRHAINQNMLTVVIQALDEYVRAVKNQLNRTGGSPEGAKALAQLFLWVGRYACQRRSPDALHRVFRYLAELVDYCNAYPRNWREAADAFNDILKELYDYSEE